MRLNETLKFKSNSQVWDNFWQLEALFTSKALFVLKIFKFLSWIFGYEVKQLDKKNKVNFKF